MTSAGLDSTFLSMHGGSSGTPPRSLLTAEIEELGQRLASLIKPGSPVERARRSEVRALLREAFLATQEERPLDELSELIARLQAIKRTYFEDERQALASRMSRREGFGALDDELTRCGRFEAPVEQGASRLASSIEARIDRTLSTLAEEPESEDGGDGRSMKYIAESTELVTKKVS